MNITRKVNMIPKASVIISLAVIVALSITFYFDGAGRSSQDTSALKIYKQFKAEERKNRDSSKKPTEWFTLQRAYPHDEIPDEGYKRAVNTAVSIRNATRSDTQFDVTMAGPSNVGGRITALAVNPDDNNVIYAGAALGGIFKSVDGGDTWDPISDDVPSLSVGDIAMDPANPDILYFGTGEANSSGDSYSGTGIYKTATGGLEWEFIGLPNSHHIGRIAIDPVNNNRVFVAAMGKLFGTNPERGVYRSTDYGENWEQVLYVSDSTGCIDIVINPSNPDIIFAAMWERIRYPRERRVGGLNSGIWRSTDGGDTWDKLSNGLPPDNEDNGRIGLAIAPGDNDIVYACYYDHPGYLMGIWRSTDGGDSWESRLVSPPIEDFSSFGWYFGQIWVHPADPNTVYLGDVYFWRSTDGGANWHDISGIMHVDHHALYQDADNPNYIVNGNDGGIFISNNTGASWIKSYDLPITQFYAITIDKQLPFRLYGGTQDNSTPGTITGGVDDWIVFYYGDGFYTNIDFTDSDVIYAEYQYGNLSKSTNLGNSWDYIYGPWYHDERTNWNTPVIMSPHDAQVLFYGAEKIHKTSNGGSSWNIISPDLTEGGGNGNLVYGTVTTISQSPINPDIIWAGTDEGRVWVTSDGGGAWELVSNDLIDRWCTRVTADVFDEMTAYVTFSGYKNDELLPHIFKTATLGLTWEDITGNLTDVPVNDILPDPQMQGRLYIGTDFGMFYTDDGGEIWQSMGSEMPICPVFDIELHHEARKLVAGTHGRSMYSFDISLSGINEDSDKPVSSYILGQNYPNPFNAETIIPIELQSNAQVELNVYDVNGRLVRNLIDGALKAGLHNVTFDASEISSGTYFVKLNTDDRHESRKITLIK